MVALELLAPARTADIGIAAIRCGADAVYIGGPQFGARAAAGNSIEDISRLCREAWRFGARIFVTVNTLARDEEERTEAVEMMKNLRGKGVSAFILQDTSLLPLLAREGTWEEEFHASTQCAIRTPERAAQLAAMGFSRLILERQLSLEQIRAIRKAVPASVELEAFVHGALCVCYSGDCYLSEHLTGRSANRGECAQPCRNLYDLVDGDGHVLGRNRALLSLKDLSLVGRLADLAAAGITSFKIEGRLKGESYVKNVVRAYSIALDRIVGGSGGGYCRSSFGTCRGGFTPDLNKTFNRGYTSLYLDGRRDSDGAGWNSRFAGGALGEYIGTAHHADGRSVDILLKDGIVLHNGDGLCNVAPGGKVEGFRVEKVMDGGDGGNRHASDGIARIVTKERAYAPAVGTPLWRNFDSVFERSLEKNMPDRMLEAQLFLKFGEELNVRATREDGAEAFASFSLNGLPEALNEERMKAVMESQLARSSGNIVFRIGGVDCSGNGPEGPCGSRLPLMSAAFLNSIRRQMAQELEAVPVKSRGGSNGYVGTTVTAACAGDSSTTRPGPGLNIPAAHIPLTHPREAGILMRSRYCIRAELGLCLKDKPANKEKLFLKNNGRLLALDFDCRSCEMTVSEAQ